MAVPARTFSVEDFLAASRVANRYRGGVDISHGANVGHDAGQLGVLKLVRRHGCTRHAGGDQAAQIFVGDRLAELAASQIDIRDRIAVHAVAERAIGPVEARAQFNFGLAVLAGVLLCGDLFGRHAAEQQCGPKNGEGMRRSMSTDSTENSCGIMGAAREWMQQVTIRCFVSSTWFDLQPERDAVETLLQRFRETKFIGMEYFGSRDETTRQVSVDEVDRSDLYVGVIGGRYGSGITEAEYDRAIERKLPCLIYFKHEAAIEPEGRDQQPAEIENLRKFKDKIRDHLPAIRWRNSPGPTTWQAGWRAICTTGCSIDILRRF